MDPSLPLPGSLLCSYPDYEGNLVNTFANRFFAAGMTTCAIAGGQCMPRLCEPENAFDNCETFSRLCRELFSAESCQFAPSAQTNTEIVKGERCYYFVRHVQDFRCVKGKNVLFAVPVEVARRDEILHTEVPFIPETMFFRGDALYLTRSGALPLKFSACLLSLECEISRPGVYVALEGRGGLLAVDRGERAFSLLNRRHGRDYDLGEMRLALCDATGAELHAASVPAFDVCIPTAADSVVLLHASPPRIVVLGADLAVRRTLELADIAPALALGSAMVNGCMYVEETGEVLFSLGTACYVLRAL